MEDCGCQIEKERDRYQRRKTVARSGGCGFAEMGIGLYGEMGSLDVDRSSWRRVAWMMTRVVMAGVDWRHAAVKHGDEIQWVQPRWCWGAISMVL